MTKHKYYLALDNVLSHSVPLSSSSLQWRASATQVISSGAVGYAHVHMRSRESAKLRVSSFSAVQRTTQVSLTVKRTGDGHLSNVPMQCVTTEETPGSEACVCFSMNTLPLLAAQKWG